MNYIITIIVSACIVLFSINSVPFNDLEKAFSEGDANKIMAISTSKVLISIEGEEGAYSQSQGTQVLSNFFKNNPPKSFIFKFKGKEEGSTTFAVGYYESEKNYRVSMKLKKEKDQYLIESLSISSAKKRHRRR